MAIKNVTKVRISQLILGLVVPILMLSLAGCGSGGNDVRAVISLSATMTDTVIQVEMVKDVASTQGQVTVTAAANLSDVDASVGTIVLQDYQITFTRTDGGVVPSPLTGGIGTTIAASSVGSSLPSLVVVDVIVYESSDKIFGAVAQELAQNDYAPIILNASMRINGRSNAGESHSTTVNFSLELGVFQPTDILEPQIESLTQTRDLVLGEDYFAFWRTSGRVDQGLFILPWGDQLFLQPSFFPFGSVNANTGFLASSIEPGTSDTFASGVLFVSNPFGTAEFNSNLPVTVTAPDPPPDPPPLPDLVISNFFADRTTITEGESVNLNWEITGGATQLELLPDTYSGIPVDFTGKDPAFDFVSIQPEFTVRPILRATRAEDGATTTAFLSAPIVVEPVVIPEMPPQILFFQVNRTSVPVAGRVVFDWAVAGDISKVELFPINGQRIDVTNVNSLVSAPLLEPRVYSFSLVAFGDDDGEFAKQDVSVTVAEENNLPVTILNVIQEPSASINNDDQGAFRFTISDPERRDSSWRVRKVAGDSVSFFPSEGRIPGGLGDADVSFDDQVGNTNGFIVFEISAYDDDQFGFSNDSTRAVELVTFTTAGVLTDNAPVISDLEFIEGGPTDFPGSSGVIRFRVTDPDTLRLGWSVSIVDGDEGGTLSPRTGLFETGGGDVSVTYEDDPDSPEDPVVFLIRVDELTGNNRQFSLATLRVVKGPEEGGPASGTSPTQPIAVPFTGLFSNFSGGVEPTDALANFTIFYNGDNSDPRFSRNSDLSGEFTAASFVLDFLHVSSDPSQINDVAYSRSFLPGGSLENTGDLNFVGYFDTPGIVGSGSGTPIEGGVTRWRMTFTTEGFRVGPNDYNLPTSGSMNYTVEVTATDTDNNTETLTKTLRVIVP